MPEQNGDDALAKAAIASFVSEHIALAGQSLRDGEAGDASAILKDCAARLEASAGDWLTVARVDQLLVRFSESPWKVFVSAPLSAGPLTPAGDQKELIRRSLALMIHKTESLVERSGEHLIETRGDSRPELVHVLRSLASDASLLGEDIEEALNCFDTTEDLLLQAFYQFASAELTEMTHAFDAVVTRRAK